MFTARFSLLFYGQCYMLYISDKKIKTFEFGDEETFFSPSHTPHKRHIYFIIIILKPYLCDNYVCATLVTSYKSLVFIFFSKHTYYFDIKYGGKLFTGRQSILDSNTNVDVFVSFSCNIFKLIRILNILLEYKW